MNWISVKEKGLPEPDHNKEYFVLFPNGIGYGTFSLEYEYKRREWVSTGKGRWYLDFDAAGNEEKITYYALIEYPDGYWDYGEGKDNNG